MSMAITVQSRQAESRSGHQGGKEAAGGQQEKEAAAGGHMLHTTPAPSMPARTQGPGASGGQAILASSQHSSWHHQASEYPHPHPHVVCNKDPTSNHSHSTASHGCKDGTIFTVIKIHQHLKVQYVPWNQQHCIYFKGLKTPI